MLPKILLSIFIFTNILCGKNINIAVAANVSYAINNLIKEFNKLYPNINIRTTLGSSGKLTAQIKNNAPFNIFMSANMKYPQALYDANISITKPIIYAKGSLVYLSNKKQDFKKGLNLLKSKKIKRVAIANPKTAPYGKATMEVLKNSKIYNKIKHKLVFAESASQTVSYTITATDIGFIAKSALYSSKMKKFKKDINWANINLELYTPINQGIVILKNGKNIEEAKLFYNFILSNKAKKIFKDFGYIICYNK
jgi:molybdate transport system substrate-binding protein